MRPSTISRRSLFATAISGTVTWLAGYPFLPSDARRAYDSELITLCSRLRCPATVRRACLHVFPASEGTRSSLARAILADIEMAPRKRAGSDETAQAFSERSRTDFQDGRIVTVEGWILSLTETRVYALAALLPETDDSRISTKKCCRMGQSQTDGRLSVSTLQCRRRRM